MRNDRPSVLSGFAAGAVGGALGTLALLAFQLSSLRATRAMESAPEAPDSLSSQQQGLLDMFDVAHARAADAATGAAGVDLTPEQRKAAPPVAEFAFGIVCSGVYGAIAEYVPCVPAGSGAAYGAALYFAASIVVLPAIGYIPAARERTPVQLLGGLLGNVLYGSVTEKVRAALR